MEEAVEREMNGKEKMLNRTLTILKKMQAWEGEESDGRKRQRSRREEINAKSSEGNKIVMMNGLALRQETERTGKKEKREREREKQRRGNKT